MPASADLPARIQKKRHNRPSVVASAAGRKPLLYIWDHRSGRRFLVDTGAEVSVIPPSGIDTRSGNIGTPLTAANRSSIKTYGVRTIPLTFDFNRFKWEFIIADVSQPLLGADFLRAHSLLVDVKGQRLVNSKTFESMALHHANFTAPHLGSIPGYLNSPVHDQPKAWSTASHIHHQFTTPCTRMQASTRQASTRKGGVSQDGGDGHSASLR